MITEVLVNGIVSDGKIAVTDSTVLRGDGCFEVLKSYGGQVFALDEHLERLQSSAEALEITLPPTSDLAKWIQETAGKLEDCAVRVVVTRGSSVPGVDGAPNVIVFGQSWSREGPVTRLGVVEAPWHAAGVDWELAGAKLTSYAPNLSATRRARSEGFDDALLVTTDGVVLEGPTFSVAWVIDGVIETPGLDMGILDSITRRVVLREASRLNFHVVEGKWIVPRLNEATEMMAFSTIREVQSVVEIGGLRMEPGPVTAALAESFRSLVG
ncbi:MAG: aminotransferase class IV [Acidimicrobiia bacterium]